MTVAALEGVTCSRGGREVLRGATLHIDAGERVALVGPNGAGKTTLLRALLGLEEVSQGKVTRCARGAGYVPQTVGESLFPWFSLRRNVAMPRLLAHRDDAADVATRLCARLLPEVAPDRRAGDLSGGEQQAAALARALASVGDIVVADEPFSALAADARSRAVSVVRDELRGRALLLVTHARGDATELCERVLRVDGGTVIEEGRDGA